jgi:rubrerythrin
VNEQSQGIGDRKEPPEIIRWREPSKEQIHILRERRQERGLRAYPAGKIGDTAENLLAAAEGELLEWGTLYPDFEEVAKKEGFKAIAKSFEEIAEVEEQHEIRYRKLLENVKNGTVFKRDIKVPWKCRNCGYVHVGKEPPQMCPACQHAQSYYELLAENY